MSTSWLWPYSTHQTQGPPGTWRVAVDAALPWITQGHLSGCQGGQEVREEAGSEECQGSDRLKGRVEQWALKIADIFLHIFLLPDWGSPAELHLTWPSPCLQKGKHSKLLWISWEFAQELRHTDVHLTLCLAGPLNCDLTELLPTVEVYVLAKHITFTILFKARRQVLLLLPLHRQGNWVLEYHNQYKGEYGSKPRSVWSKCSRVACTFSGPSTLSAREHPQASSESGGPWTLTMCTGRLLGNSGAWLAQGPEETTTVHME